MTLANKVTIGRILLIPVFVVAVLYYQESGVAWHRWLALGVFLTASLSDALDGWIARRFHQRSQLGAVLDPLHPNSSDAMTPSGSPPAIRSRNRFMMHPIY